MLFALMLVGLVERLQDGAMMERYVGMLLLVLSCTPIAIGALGVLLEVPACIDSVRELRGAWQRAYRRRPRLSPRPPTPEGLAQAGQLRPPRRRAERPAGRP